MTRKKTFILGGALLAMVTVTGTVVWFMGAAIFSYLPSIGQAKSSSETKPEEQQTDARFETHPTPHEDETAPAGEAEHAEAEGQIADDSHGRAAKSGKDAGIALIPAPDYVPPHSRTSSIVNAVRHMNTMQTRMAKGEKDAPKALKSVMSSVRALIAKKEGAQMSVSEVQSVANYVLSGGDPLVVERLIKSESLLPEQKSLLAGVMSYATADFVKASELLIPLDPRKFEIALSAQLSMAQAQLAKTASHSDNIKRLAYAADVIPGTLIEEAATRRILPHLASAGDVKMFSYWTQRYLRRFPDSLYYQDFEIILINGIGGLLAGKSGLNEQSLANIFRVAREMRAAAVARQILVRAILEGNTSQCALIEKSLESSFDLGLKSLEAALVLIKICKLTEAGVDELAALKSIDVSGLDEEVKLHLSKAIAMSQQIQKGPPLEDDGRAGPHLPLSADEAYSPLFASVAQQMDASVSAIRRVDEDEADSNN